MTLKEELLHEGAFAELAIDRHAALEVQSIETHISWVFLVGEHAFKVKKPAFLGFLDFRTLEARKSACDAELELNRRLAKNVYLEVLPITRDERGVPRFGGTGNVVDWAVHMRRLSDAARADNLLAQGKLGRPQIDRIAQVLAEFHRGAHSTAARRFGAPDVVAENVRENFAQTRDTITEYLSERQAAELERFQRDFLREHEGLFLRRENDGRIHDGHGDLRLEHVYFRDNGEIDVIDCIEFNERFRYADVCADIAFLSMDLAEHDCVELAERLLARYALLSDDFALYGLVDFYQSYRAHVRAKVSSIVAASADIEEQTRLGARSDARRYYLLALSAARRTIAQPTLIVVCGVIASGKSVISDLLGAELPAPVIEADRTRKALLGVKPETALDDAPFRGHYDEATSAQVYEEVLRRAAVVLASGRSVIVDASFRSAAKRAAARDLSLRLGVPFQIIECSADRETCLERLRERQNARGVSDGRLEIFDEFCARYEPITEFSSDEHIVLNTTLSTAHNLELLRKRFSLRHASPEADPVAS